MKTNPEFNTIMKTTTLWSVASSKYPEKGMSGWKTSELTAMATISPR